MVRFKVGDIGRVVLSRYTSMPCGSRVLITAVDAWDKTCRARPLTEHAEVGLWYFTDDLTHDKKVTYGAI